MSHRGSYWLFSYCPCVSLPYSVTFEACTCLVTRTPVHSALVPSLAQTQPWPWAYPSLQNDWVQKSSHQSHGCWKQPSHPCPWVSSLATTLLTAFVWGGLTVLSCQWAAVTSSTSLCTSPLEEQMDPFSPLWLSLHVRDLGERWIHPCLFHFPSMELLGNYPSDSSRNRGNKCF